MKASLYLCLFFLTVQFSFGQITLHSEEFPENPEELIAEFSKALSGTWRINPGLAQSQNTDAIFGRIEDEAELPFSPLDSLIYFSEAGTFWTNDSTSRKNFTVEIAPYSGMSYVDSTGNEITQWSFNLILAQETYFSGISSQVLSIGKHYSNWSWERYLSRNE